MKKLILALIIFVIAAGAYASESIVVAKRSVELQISALTDCYAIYKFYQKQYELKDYAAFELLEHELGKLMIYISKDGQRKRITSARLLQIAFDYSVKTGDPGVIIHNKVSSMTDPLPDYLVKIDLSRHKNYIINLGRRYN